MSDLVLIPVNGDWIALTREQYAQARDTAQRVGFGVRGPTAGNASDEHLCTAEEVAKHLGVPTSRIAQQARERVIPSVRVGRSVRFKRSEVEAALRSRPQAERGAR